MKTSSFVKLVGVTLLCLAGLDMRQASAANASGLPWSSGVFTGHDKQMVTNWENWRGRRADVITVFPSRESWDTMLSTWWYNALPDNFSPSTQDLVVTLPLWPQNGNSVNDTGTDAQWRLLADRIEAKDPNAWVRLGWEMNLPGSYWRITAQNKSQWASAFRRVVTLMKSVAPGLRFVFNPNRGPDQSCSVPAGAVSCTREVFQLVKSKVEAYGIDSYDSWNPVTSDASYNLHFYDYGGMVESAVFAHKNGKLFAVPEWGIACNVAPDCQWTGHAGGDNPLYIEEYLNFFYEYRTVMAFESYYEENDAFIRSALSVTPIGTQAPLFYRTKIKGFGIR